MITKDDILTEAAAYRKLHPQQRLGQSIFNYVDTHPELFGNAARISQFNYGVDCFYRDDQIDAFINQVLDIVNGELID